MSCPCLRAVPCHPDCTCIVPISSRGCSRCCSYGSDEQRQAMAKHLASRIDFPAGNVPEQSVMLWVVESRRADGTMRFDNAYTHLFNAVDHANEWHEEDKCCPANELDDDFDSPCPGGCEVRSPRIVRYLAMRVK